MKTARIILCTAHLHPFCVSGCDIVQADHAPDGGVAQGIFHGILVRHHGRNQEEVEEELEQEVKRTGGRRRSRNNQVHMHGWDEVTRHGRGLEPM